MEFVPIVDLRSVAFWLVWHSFVVVLLFGVVALRLGGPIWGLESGALTLGALLSTGYLLAAGILHLSGPDGGLLRRAAGVVRAGLAGYTIPLLLLLFLGIQFSRFSLISGLFIGAAALPVAFLFQRGRQARLALLGLAVAGILWVTSTAAFTVRAPTVPSVEVADHVTNLHVVRATTYRNHLPLSQSFFSGGAMAPAGDGYVIATGDGSLAALSLSAGGEVTVRELSGRVPLDRDGFVSTAGTGGFVSWFRVLDVATTPDGSALYASYHHWNETESCFVVRVSRLSMPVDDLLREQAALEWTTAYDTTPCLPLEMSEPSWPFRGMEGGGRMWFLDETTLLLTVGDQGFNGFDFEVDFVQDPTADYGKSLRIDLRDGTSTVYSTGHRNPQGLWVDESGAAFLAEHGPEGGDELNRLVEGGNYGWATVTYGTDYGQTEWPLSAHQGHHEGFIKPLFAWVPSVGLSNLVRMHGAQFRAWQGDFLVGSMAATTLWRVRVDDDRVIVTEPIPLGERVRDLLETPDGTVLVLTDSYSVITLEPVAVPYAVCAGCHSFGGGSDGLVGPDLQGVVGRQIGAIDRFPYSPALSAMDGVWTEEALDAYLADPQSFAAGTSMQLDPIEDAEARRQIIEYLKRQQ